MSMFNGMHVSILMFPICFMSETKGNFHGEMTNKVYSILFLSLPVWPEAGVCQGVTIRVSVPKYFGTGLMVQCTFHFDTYRKKIIIIIIYFFI